MEDHSAERRLKVRFPVKLNVRYRTLAGPQMSGAGQTINMSSGGLLIAANEPRELAGIRLHITVEWPLLLHGMTPLQLSAACKVVRCDETLFAVRLEKYQFRTRRSEGVDLLQALAAEV